MTHPQFTNFLVESYLSALVTIFLISSCDHVNESTFLEPATPVGLEWVIIPGGNFFMGSNEWFDEQPMSRVAIKRFEMNRAEITVSQYRECVDAKICSEPDSGGEYENWNEPGYEDHPVNALDWYQARAFCNWVGGDLPSESMWEYAAKR